MHSFLSLTDYLLEIEVQNEKINDLKCVLCKKEDEIIDHLFLTACFQSKSG